MKIPILIEPAPGRGYRARGETFGLVAEGSTRDEALEELRILIAGRLAQGVELVSLDVSAREHPWAEFAGTLKDEPLYDDWREAMADYRSKVDSDRSAP
jgi:hypothetical protein